MGRGRQFQYGHLLRQEIPALNGLLCNKEQLRIVYEYICKLKDELEKLKTTKEETDGKEKSS